MMTTSEPSNPTIIKTLLIVVFGLLSGIAAYGILTHILSTMTDEIRVPPIFLSFFIQIGIFLHTVVFYRMALIIILNHVAAPHIQQAKRETDNFKHPLPEPTHNPTVRNRLTAMVCFVAIICGYALFFQPYVLFGNNVVIAAYLISVFLLITQIQWPNSIERAIKEAQNQVLNPQTADKIL